MTRLERRTVITDREILASPRGRLQDQPPELRRRHPGDRERQLRGGVVQAPYFLPAGLAALQVLLEALSLGVLQSVKRVGAAETVRITPHELHAPAPRQSRILIRPSRILVLIVPSAMLSNPAT